MRVVVIGAGIAGLSLAIALRRVGIDVVVCERAAELREVGAGISLWGNAIRSLERIGAAEIVKRAAEPVVMSDFRRADGRVMLTLDNQEFEKKHGLDITLYLIHRAELVEALASQLPTDALRFGLTFTELCRSETGVEAVFADGSTESGDVLVGADGLNSAVRAELFGRSPPTYSGYTGWRGVCTPPVGLWPTGHCAEVWGRGLRFGITSLTGGRIYWWAGINQPMGVVQPNSRAYLLERYRKWASPVPQIIEATPAEKIIQNDIFDRPPLPAWHQGRVVLMGDAAHPTTPNYGQGGCVSLEDAAVLARCLAEEPSIERAFTQYQAERFTRTTRLTRESRLLGKIGQWSHPMACALRDTLTSAIPMTLSFHNMLKMVAYDPGVLPQRLNQMSSTAEQIASPEMT